MNSPWIKICGLRDADSVAHCLALGVDALGFVFAPSVRQVTVQDALRLAEPARGRAKIVAVLRTASDDIAELIQEFEPDFLQMDYSATRAGAGASSSFALEPCTWLPVVREGQAVPDPLPELMLYEGGESGVGQLANWQEAAFWASRTRLVLAGGLTPDNVAQAIERVRPFGVDVSSGVERERGVKCLSRIKEFVMTARAVSCAQREFE